MPQTVTAVLTVITVLTVLSCGEPVAPFDGVFDYEMRFEVDTVVRRALVHVPAGYDGSAAVPLVLAFHGGGGTAEELRDMTALDRTGDALGMVVAFPAGNPDWETQNDDDRRYTRELIERISRRLLIDADRVYATGFSNGGRFTLDLGCRDTGRFAAIAPVAITFSDEEATACSPSGRIPILMAMGAVDLVVPLAGDSASGRLSARETIDVFARRNGCDPTPRTATEPDTDGDGRLVRLTEFTGCAGDVETLLYVYEATGHRWPDEDVPASTLIGGFLLRHRR